MVISMKNSKSFAVIGMGRFGRAVAMQLFNLGHEVMAIDIDETLIQSVSDYVTDAVVCDAKDESVLRGVSIKNYDCVIVAIGSRMNDSILTTLLLKELGVKNVVCKANDINHKKILLKIGADSVIIPEYEMGIKYASQLVSKNIIDIIELSSEYAIAEFKVPVAWAGKTIAELDLRRKKNINIVAVKHGGKAEEVNITPSPGYSFDESDVVVIVGPEGVINSIGKA